MSNKDYRYYNSENGVGVICVTDESGDFFFIKGRAKYSLPWVAKLHVHMTVGEAKGKPHAIFYKNKPLD